MKHQWKLDKNGTPDEWAWDIGFHNGVYCERCGKTVCVHCNLDWESMDDCKEPPKPNPTTNADRIRAMTDEELAGWIDRPVFGRGCHFCNMVSPICDEKCSEHLLEWLQQPAEGE